jgi:hypothetical protein
MLEGWFRGGGRDGTLFVVATLLRLERGMPLKVALCRRDAAKKESQYEI